MNVLKDWHHEKFEEVENEYEKQGGGQRRNTAPANTQNSTFQTPMKNGRKTLPPVQPKTPKQIYKYLSSGNSSNATVKPENVMVNAIVNLKNATQQRDDIQNRINKFARQEAKATKMIKDLQMRQKFVSDMNQEKLNRM